MLALAIAVMLPLAPAAGAASIKAAAAPVTPAFEYAGTEQALVVPESVSGPAIFDVDRVALSVDGDDEFVVHETGVVAGRPTVVRDSVVSRLPAQEGQDGVVPLLGCLEVSAVAEPW